MREGGELFAMKKLVKDEMLKKEQVSWQHIPTKPSIPNPTNHYNQH